MRILHVTDTFLPRLGGIELHVADLAQRQAAAGHDVLVLTAEDAAGTNPAAALPEGVQVRRVRSGVLGAGSGGWVGPLMASFAPDIVHAHLTVGSPFTWAVLRNCAGVPALASLHSLLPRSPGLIRAGIRLVGLPTERITFTAVSEVAAARLRPALGPDEDVQVLHNGIDPTSWTVGHAPLGRFHIVSVGRLAPRKRPLVLIAALAELAHAAPDLDWAATIVGDGGQRRQVAAAVRAHGLGDRVHLPGALPREQIRRLLASADAFVAPATLESFGIAALEARCAGVPIVGMAASGLTEFVDHGVEGLLAETDADIARALHRLAHDPGLTETIRRHNATTPVLMQWPTVLGRHEQLYASAIQSSPVRRSARATSLLP